MALFRRKQRRPKPTTEPFNEGIYHRPPAGLSFFKTGILALILIMVLSFFAYTKKLPWSDEGYTATATFADATTLRQTSPVRIAGVNVGKVTEVAPDGEGAKVTFTVDDEGLPLHEDATIVIRPRLFLEGNFFLDLRPGSPSAPELPDGGDIPVTQTAVAVQLDQVLTTLQRPDRRNLARLLDGYSAALADEPTAEQDVGQDPEVQGLSGAQALNEAFTYGARAGKGTAQVNQALLGDQAGDLRGLVRASGQVFEELASTDSDLRGLITNFNITTGALNDESASLEDTLTELAPTVERAQTQLVDINESFPPLRAFARELTPAVEELPGTIRAGNPWLTQARLLLRPGELGGVARDLRIAEPFLSRGAANLDGALAQLRPFSRCVTDVLDPTSETQINDRFATGRSGWEEFLFGLPSLAGTGGNFDGNGTFLRIQPAGGPVPVSTPIPGGSPGIPNVQPPDNVNYGNTIEAPIGTQPFKPASEPPVKTNRACHTQDVPDLNGSQGGIGGPNPAAGP